MWFGGSSIAIFPESMSITYKNERMRNVCAQRLLFVRLKLTVLLALSCDDALGLISHRDGQYLILRIVFRH